MGQAFLRIRGTFVKITFQNFCNKTKHICPVFVHTNKLTGPTLIAAVQSGIHNQLLKAPSHPGVRVPTCSPH